MRIASYSLNELLSILKKVFDKDDPRLWRCFDAVATKSNNLGQWQRTVDLLEAKVIPYLDTRTPNSEYWTASLDAMQWPNLGLS